MAAKMACVLGLSRDRGEGKMSSSLSCVIIFVLWMLSKLPFLMALMKVDFGGLKHAAWRN